MKTVFEFFYRTDIYRVKDKKKIIFLSLDLSSAFDKILFTRIYQVLRTRRIPEWLA